MERIFSEPRVEDGAVKFFVRAGSLEREYIVSRHALAYLSRLQGHTMNAMNTYLAWEAKIHHVARRLLCAGESASPLVLGTAYFID
jgi:hypothetical protein